MEKEVEKNNSIIVDLRIERGNNVRRLYLIEMSKG